jgi:hypothetical protein
MQRKRSYFTEVLGIKLANPAKVMYTEDAPEIQVIARGITVTLNPKDVIQCTFYHTTDGKFLTHCLDLEEFTDLVVICHRLQQWETRHAS